jgi:tetrahydromethanopterin S-methyltransferase subunit F
LISEDEIRYYSQLDERQQRVFLGLKAKSLGSSGVRVVS